MDLPRNTQFDFSEVEEVDLPGVGTLEAFNTDGLRSLIRTIKAPFMKDEMLRQFGLLAAGLPADTPGAERERALQAAIRRAMDGYE